MMDFDEFYFQFCKLGGKFERLKEVQTPSEELRQNLKKVELNLSGKEVVASAYLAAILSSLIVLTALIGMFMLRFSTMILIILGPSPLFFYYAVGWYPKWKAEKGKSTSLGRFPQLISYLSAALRFNPNLENAITLLTNKKENFGKDLHRELWKTYLASNNSVEDALTEFSNKLDDEDEGIKRSIDLIKSSVSEQEYESRKKILDRSVKICFEEIQDKVESFASGLQLPTTVIYGVGVLLPLVLLAVLPIISSTGVKITGLEIGLLYCFIIPIGIFGLQKKTLSKRPVTFSNPEIELRQNKIQTYSFTFLTFTTPIIAGLALKVSNSLMMLLILWGIGGGISIFCYLSSKKSYEIREKNKKLEKEFSASLTQLASQLKSGHPPEKAFHMTAKITEGSEISKILRKTSKNLRAGGMNLKNSLFDPNRGSLKQVESQTVRTTFEIMVNFLSHSPKAAGNAISQIGEHLKNLSKVEKKAKRSLQEIVSSMKSVTLFFAPLIASITVRLQQLLLDKTQNLPFFGAGVQLPSHTFLGVLGIYIIVLTLLLTNYIVKIEQGDDKVIKRINIAKTLPISLTVFTFGFIIGGQLISIISV